MKTSRLRIQLVGTDEIDLIVQLWTDTDVTEHIGGPREADPIREYFQQVAKVPDTILAEDGDRWWSVSLRDSREWIGLCGLLAKDIEGVTEVDLSYFFLPGAWGHGYATEAAEQIAGYAFADLALPSLIAVVDPSNKRSANVAVRLGMTLEKTIPRPGGHIRQIYRLNPPDSARETTD